MKSFDDDMRSPLFRWRYRREQRRIRREQEDALMRKWNVEPGKPFESHVEVVGWGPFPLPGEDRRHRVAWAQTMEMMSMLPPECAHPNARAVVLGPPDTDAIWCPDCNELV